MAVWTAKPALWLPSCRQPNKHTALNIHCWTSKSLTKLIVKHLVFQMRMGQGSPTKKKCTKLLDFYPPNAQAENSSQGTHLDSNKELLCFQRAFNQLLKMHRRARKSLFNKEKKKVRIIICIGKPDPTQQKADYQHLCSISLKPDKKNIAIYFNMLQLLYMVFIINSSYSCRIFANSSSAVCLKHYTLSTLKICLALQTDVLLSNFCYI